jgi:hypothetical protein
MAWAKEKLGQSVGFVVGCLILVAVLGAWLFVNAVESGAIFGASEQPASVVDACLNEASETTEFEAAAETGDSAEVVAALGVQGAYCLESRGWSCSLTGKCDKDGESVDLVEYIYVRLEQAANGTYGD